MRYRYSPIVDASKVVFSDDPKERRKQVELILSVNQEPAHAREELRRNLSLPGLARGIGSTFAGAFRTMLGRSEF